MTVVLSSLSCREREREVEYTFGIETVKLSGSYKFYIATSQSFCCVHLSLPSLHPQTSQPTCFVSEWTRTSPSSSVQLFVVLSGRSTEQSAIGLHMKTNSNHIIIYTMKTKRFEICQCIHFTMVKVIILLYIMQQVLLKHQGHVIIFGKHTCRMK